MRSQNFLSFPPIMGGKFPQLPPQPLSHGGENFPPRVSPMGGKFFRKTYFPPTNGGEAGSLPCTYRQRSCTMAGQSGSAPFPDALNRGISENMGARPSQSTPSAFAHPRNLALPFRTIKWNLTIFKGNEFFYILILYPSDLKRVKSNTELKQYILIML